MATRAGQEVSQQTLELSRYIAGAARMVLPRTVVERARIHVVDTFAAMISGSRLLPGQTVMPYVRTLGGRPEAGLAGTRIVYRTPHATRLDAAIFDVSGQKIFGWPSLQLAAGSHELQWDGRSFSGSKVPAGVYLLRLESRDGAIVRKLFRVRS